MRATLAADVAAELAPSVPLSVIPDGVDLARFLDVGSGRDPGERLRMVYAGSFYGHKGVDSLLDALALLPERFELELVGGNPPGELERLRERTCDEPALKGRVSFTGHLLPSEVPARLGAADLILLPAGAESRSQRYTSPLKLFEAMATGVPIVAARAASYESVLADGRTAFVASGASGAELARAAEHAAADPARAHQVARRAMEESRDYGWERRAERIADFLEELTPVRTGLMR